MKLLRCSACFIEIEAKCNCGVAYIPKGEAAEKAVKKYPEKSNAIIAEEIRVDPETVRQARIRISANTKTGPEFSGPAPENPKHTGKDGKHYPAKRITAAEKWATYQREIGAPYPEFKIEKAKEIGRMPENTREKYEKSLAIIKENLVKLELMTDFADQMSEELRHLLTDELNGIKKHTAIIAKKMFGKDNLRDVNRPLCDVVIPLRKEIT